MLGGDVTWTLQAPAVFFILNQHRLKFRPLSLFLWTVFSDGLVDGFNWAPLLKCFVSSYSVGDTLVTRLSGLQVTTDKVTFLLSHLFLFLVFPHWSQLWLSPINCLVYCQTPEESLLYVKGTLSYDMVFQDPVPVLKISISVGMFGQSFLQSSWKVVGFSFALWITWILE